MPVKKKPDAASLPAAVEKPAKPAAKRTTTAASKPAAEKRAVKKPAAATAAATHKAPARRAVAKKASAPAFDVELHRAEIEHEAYLLWAARGHAHGHAQHDFLAAIEVVKSRHQD
ncbi:MAG TPA: hypothetical protein PLZ95_17905 [Bryobacteraceae bacterium]|nr:hypothetical protein [Bryobacteraceae bacterium]